MRDDPTQLFIFRLALALGGMTVEELLSRIGSRELSRWRAFARIEPLPNPHYSAGVVAATIHNAWTTGDRATPEDFIPTTVPRGKRRGGGGGRRRTTNPARTVRAFFGALAQQ